MTGFVAVIDPAWGADAGGGGRGAQNHYALDGPSAIAAAYGDARDAAGARIWPSFNAKDSSMLIFMWATAMAMAQKENGDPPDAYVLARLLGLRVCAMTVWCKIDEYGLIGETGVKAQTFDGTPAFTPPARMGLGQWTRVEHEYLLICRRGAVPVPEPAARPRSVIYAPRREHSAKPERAWTQVIEPISRSSMPGVIGIEFNARVQRPGWAAFGALDGEDKPLRFAVADLTRGGVDVTGSRVR